MGGGEPPAPPVHDEAGGVADGADRVGAGDGPGSGPAPPDPTGMGVPRRPRPIFLLVGVVLAVLLGIGLFTGVGTGRSSGRPQAGGSAPTFSLPRLGGGSHVGLPADGGGGGRPAVVLFFASWCGPCQKEIPALAATYRHQQEVHSRLARVALIGVDGSDPSGNALRFVHASGVTFPVAADRTYTVTEGLYYFTSLPEAVFVNGDGTIAAIHYGGLSTAQLVQWQQRLLSIG